MSVLQNNQELVSGCFKVCRINATSKRLTCHLGRIRGDLGQHALHSDVLASAAGSQEKSSSSTSSWPNWRGSRDVPPTSRARRRWWTGAN